MASGEEISSPDAFTRRFGVSRETLDRLQVYADLLRRWQKAVNLVAPGTLHQVWHRHLADSAQLYALLPPNAVRHLDIGSGGGFPGLVLAIMAADRPGWRTTLVESDQRKCAFLREIARHAGIAVEIVTKRIEISETRSMVGAVDVVTARALASLDRLLSYSSPFCSASTVGLFLKGKGVEQELAEAGCHWRFQHRLIPSVTQDGAFVVEVRHLSSV